MGQKWYFFHLPVDNFQRKTEEQFEAGKKGWEINYEYSSPQSLRRIIYQRIYYRAEILNKCLITVMGALIKLKI